MEGYTEEHCVVYCDECYEKKNSGSTKHRKRKQQSTITALFGCSTSSKKVKPDNACKLQDGKDRTKSEVEPNTSASSRIEMLCSSDKNLTDRMVLDGVHDVQEGQR